MRIGQVIGRVTLSKHHPALPSGRLLLARPLSTDALRDTLPGAAEELVIFDVLGAGVGSRVGMSEGREAANPFHPAKAPVDAYCACLLDRTELD